MKVIRLAIGVGVVIGATIGPRLAVAQAPVDFSGVWEMDVLSSDSPETRDPGPQRLEIVQTDTALVRTTHRPDEVRTLTYRFDGIETVGESGVVRTQAEWRGESLWTHTVWRVEGMAVTTTTLYTLTNDDNVLVTENTLTVQHGYQGTGDEPGNYSTTRDIFTRVE